MIKVWAFLKFRVNFFDQIFFQSSKNDFNKIFNLKDSFKSLSNKNVMSLTQKVLQHTHKKFGALKFIKFDLAH